MNRLLRKIVHITIGLVVFLAVNIYGKWIAESALCFCLLVGIFLQDQKIKGKSLTIVDYLLKKLDKSESMPGLSAMQYFVGLLVIISFLELVKINAGLIILVFGDGIASLINGRIRWPHNKDKTIEGSFVFFVISSLACYLYIGAGGLIAAFLITMVESISFKGISDNITIPVATVILFKLI